MSKDELLNDLERNLIFLFDVALEHIHFPDLKKESIKKAVNQFILMDARTYTTQTLRDILDSPDTALILFVKYMEGREMVKAGNETIH